ncbi:MAG: hypothetical protein AAGB16_07420, partial [Pseudomonadota bacterium]
ETYFDFETAFLLEPDDGILVGEEAIMAQRQFDQTPSPVFWNPVGSMASGDADLGITWGKFGFEGDPNTQGSYLTVWRKVDGEWKIVTDVAVNDHIHDHDH